jgi:hypothetical protein
MTDDVPDDPSEYGLQIILIITVYILLIIILFFNLKLQICLMIV